MADARECDKPISRYSYARRRAIECQLRAQQFSASLRDDIEHGNQPRYLIAARINQSAWLYAKARAWAFTMLRSQRDGGSDS